jgi:serine protease inhibitor ecotin
MTHEELEERVKALEQVNDHRPTERLRRWLADKLMPWAAGNATVWPSQANMHAGLLEEQAELHQANEELTQRIVELQAQVDDQEATRLRTVIKHVIEADQDREFLPHDMRAYLVGHTRPRR